VSNGSNVGSFEDQSQVGVLFTELENAHKSFIIGDDNYKNVIIHTSKRTLSVGFYKEMSNLAIIRCSMKHRDGSECYCDEFEVAQRIEDGMLIKTNRDSCVVDSHPRNDAPKRIVVNRKKKAHLCGVFVCIALLSFVICEFLSIVLITIAIAIICDALNGSYHI